MNRLDLIGTCLALAVTVLIVALSSAVDFNALCLASAESEVFKNEAANCMEFWFNRYQTLFAAGAALMAAFVGYKAVRAQINHADRMDREKLQRSNLAARSTMPLALNTVCEYATDCIRVFEEHKDFQHNPGISATSPAVLPRAPSGAIEPLRCAVEFSETPQGREVADLLAALQVFLARIRENGWQSSTVELEDRMLDVLDLYARASRLFEYARSGIMERSLVTAEDLRKVARIFNIDSSLWPWLEGRLEMMEKDDKQQG